MREQAQHHGLGKVTNASQCFAKGVVFAGCVAAVEMLRAHQKSCHSPQPTAFVASPTIPRRQHLIPHAKAWSLLAAEGVHTDSSHRLHSSGGARGFLATFATAFVSLRCWQRRTRTRLRARRTGRFVPRPKKKRSFGPKKLKSGYWQEGDAEDDVDIFEWIAAEDLEEDPPAQVTNVHRVGEFTAYDDFEPMVYNPPEYRTPEMKQTLKKGTKRLPLVDQDGERSFMWDMRNALNWCSDGKYNYEHLDVICSYEVLRTLMAFVDGSLTEDIRAKGKNTRRGVEAEMVDLIRIIRLPDAPQALGLATVWNWVPEAQTHKNPRLNRTTYDLSMQRLATGKPLLAGPRSIREDDGPEHWQLLEYDCGGLRLLVRAPVMSAMPSVDVDDVEGHAVNVHTVNIKKAGNFWGSSLVSRYAEMQLGDVGMVVRGVLDRGTLVDIQELTREDLRLDRPLVASEADRLLGRLAGLIHRIREVASCAGAVGRPMYIQYGDAELQVVAPILDDDFEGDPWEEDVGQATFHGAVLQNQL